MTAQWTGEVIGKMHIENVSMKALAAEIGWHPKYLSAVMNGHRTPKDAEEKVRTALNRLVAFSDSSDSTT